MSLRPPAAPRHAHFATARTSLRPVRPTGKLDGPELFDPETLASARVSAVLAARRTSDFVPFACAAEIESVEVHYTHVEDSLAIEVRVEGVSRSGLETQARLAASVCAITLSDIANGTEWTIGPVEIVDSGGGLHDKVYDFDPPLGLAILVVSDAVLSGRKEDRAGDAVRASLDELSPMGVKLVSDEVVPDDVEAVRAKVRQLCADDVEVILCVGGTGLTDDDHTIEAIEPLLDQPIPGLMEAVRTYGQERTPRAFVSRGIAGLIGETLVVTIPGSTAGAREAMQALGPSFLHVPYVRRRSERSIRPKP